MTDRKKVIRFSFLLLLGFLYGGFSQLNAQITMGARGAALNNATTALSDYQWAIFSNAALLPEDFNSSSFYAVRFYNLEAFTHLAAVTTYQLPWGTAGAGFHTVGDDLYRETHAVLSYRYQYSWFYGAVTASYSHFAFGGTYGSHGAVGINLAVAAKITSDLTVGGNVVNINRPAIGENEEELPRSLSIGASYRVSDRVLILGDAVKDVRYPLGVRGGLEITLIEGVFVRAGWGIEPETVSFGSGFYLSDWEIDIAMERHEFLGWSPGINVSYRW